MKKFRVISISMILIITLFTVCYAESLNNNKINYQAQKSVKYKNWEGLSSEQKKTAIEPAYNAINLKTSVKKSKYNQIIRNEVSDVPGSFNLKNEISNLNVKNQKKTGSCWAFSYTSMLETTMANKYQKNNITYSPMHLDYATTKIFNREPGDGGNSYVSLAYSASGIGPVYETDFPFDSVYNEEQNSTRPYYLADINGLDLNKTPKARVKRAQLFPGIYKTYEGNNIKYYNDYDEEYTTEQVNTIRSIIKQHIKDDGGVAALFYADALATVDQTGTFTSDYYNSATHAYYYKNSEANNHGVTIVGWDDNFPKENFASGNQPTSNGAYIVLNSWGTEFGDQGLFYVSYEDSSIEQQIYGIIDIEELDQAIYKTYEYDPLGMNYAIVAVDKGQNNANAPAGFAANVFTRDTNEKEYLSEVGLYIMDTEGVEIYVNAASDDKSTGDLVASYTGENALESGYHSIKLNSPVELNANKFVVKVKYINQNLTTIPVETNLYDSGLVEESDTMYSTVRSNSGESFISIDGSRWEDIHELPLDNTVTLRNTNACIKAITTSEAPAENVPVTGVQLDKSTATMNVGDTLKLNATIAPENATNKNITWTSSDPTTATVSNGTITAVKQGTVEITATTEDGNKTAKCTVTIGQSGQVIHVEGISIDKKTATINVGGTVNLVATITPENATNKGYVWEHPTRETEIISMRKISEDEIQVTGLAEGTEEITVKTSDGNKTDTCTITVQNNGGGNTVAVTGVQLDKSTATMKVGDTLKLNATVTPDNATNKNVSWRSSDETIATVNNGTITAVKEGTAEITVTTEDGNKTAKCTVTVQNNGGGNTVAVTGVELDKSTATISVGDTVKVNATVKPDNATNKNVTWKSSDEKVAKVQNGTITGIGEGQALITVTTEDGNKTAGVEVVVRGERPPQEEVKVSGVSLDKRSATIKVTDTINLIATITPENATNKNVKWKTSDENVAKVENGVVTGIGEGTAMITVITEDGNCQDSAKITVVKNSSSDDDIYKEKEVIDTKQKDDTLSPRILPNTGKGIIITIFAIIVIGLTISYIKYRKMKDVK